MSWLLDNLLATLVLPPMSLLIALTLGIGLRNRWRGALHLAWLALAGLWALSMPWVGASLLAGLEAFQADPLNPEAQAIVVLGGGIHANTPEYGGDTLKSQTLERLRYAARLHRVTGLPVLVTGGRPEGGAAEAVLMAEALNTDFGIRPRWVESTSQNTSDNARFSRHILQPRGTTRILLVTHGWHMRRAAATFTKAGFTVYPAPTMRYAGHPLQLLDLLPSASGLMQSRTALHEWLGWLWYGLLGRI